MIRGIGVDTAGCEDFERYLSPERADDPFLRRTFTERERAAAAQRPRPAEYYAGRFAAKEAVFKALGHLLPEKTFDFRVVETLTGADGSPYVNVTGKLEPVLKAADVDRLHISITTEGGRATAFAVAEKRE